MDSTTVCDYFINDQAMGGICAASLSDYLCYFSSFLFYFHDKNRIYFPYEKYKELDQKLQGNSTIIATLSTVLLRIIPPGAFLCGPNLP